jgi:hypothetical protein
MKKILFFSLVCAFVLSSCKKDLTSCIELDSKSVSIGQTINFTSCSQSELSYSWTIAGPVGAPENEKGWSDRMFSHTFTVAGSYTVTLDTYSEFSLLGEKETSTATFSVN